MPLVTYKDLCIDVNDLRVGLDFWAPTLGLEVVPDDDDPEEFHLVGPTPQHTVWPCVVPEPKTVKNRVHVDVLAGTPELPGTTRLSPRPGGGAGLWAAEGSVEWTVVSGPEGDELCVFEREEVPDYRLYGVVVDSADHAGIAGWWQSVWGGRLEQDEDEFVGLDQVPGLPFDGFVFALVPEPKTVKNRVHWDVRLAGGATVDDLVGVGATVLRRPDEEIEWTVMADPEGNEFCVFAEDAT